MNTPESPTKLTPLPQSATEKYDRLKKLINPALGDRQSINLINLLN